MKPALAVAKTEIELAKEKLAQAKAEYAAAEEMLDGSHRRFYAARQALWAARGELTQLGETRYEGEKKI